MAQVFQAMDEVLVRPVAVKVLHGHLTNDAAFVERFRHEAIAAARLSHPSIVSIYDTVSDDGLEAIVMELVHGTTLRRRLDAVRILPVDQVVAVGSQVADALDTAHRSHVVHRDIKPANILLSTDGRVMVADFGIAKALEGADLTAEGAMLGTAKYLAPEQVEGTAVDGRTDLYSLGIVLYEALCGRVPFQADTHTGTALARLHQAPLRPRQIRADIPHRIEDVVMRAMARHPGDRFEDAQHMRAALLACVTGRPTVQVTTDDTAETGRSEPVGAPVRDRTPVPPAAVPHRAAEVADERPPSFSQSERGWLLPALLIVLVAVALGVAGVLFGQSDTGHRLFGDETKHPTTVVAKPLTITSAAAFDPPPGDGVEDDQDAPKAIDGNPATSWHTETYDAAPEFGTKEGVGLMVTLDRSAPVKSLTIQSQSVGWSVEIYATNGSPGDTLASWGRPVASHSDIAAGTTTFDLKGTKASHVLLWITRLTETGRVNIAEVRVVG
jgi:serine/threonine-protein kinase